MSGVHSKSWPSAVFRTIRSLVLLSLLVPRPSRSQDIPLETAPAAATYQDQELVEVELFGEWVTGQIVKAMPEGSYRVRVQYKGRRSESTFPPDKIRRATEQAVIPLTELREWKDKSGKHRLKARLIDVKESEDANEAVVQLLKSDGATIDVPFARLCTTDQLLARRLARRAAEERSRDNPQGQEAGPGGFSGERGRDGAAMALEPVPNQPAGSERDGNVPTERADSRSSVAVDSNAPPEGRSSQPAAEPSAIGGLLAMGSELLAADANTAADGAPAVLNSASAKVVGVSQAATWSVIPDVAPPAGATPTSITLNISGTPDLAKSRVAIGTSMQWAAVAAALGDGSTTELHLLDLVNATVATTHPWPTSVIGLDVSSDGKLLALLTSDAAESRFVHVLSLEDGSPKPKSAWKLSGSSEPQGLYLLEENKVLVWQTEEAMVVDISTANQPAVVWKTESPVSGLAIGPGRKSGYVAFDAGIAVVSLQSGEVVGWIKANDAPIRALSVRGDGGQLATLSPGGLRLVNLTDGSEVELFPIDTGSAPRMDWLGDPFVLLDRTELLDVSQKRIVWRFTDVSGSTVPMAVMAGQVVYLYAEPGNASVTPTAVVMTMPPPELVEQLSFVDPSAPAPVGTTILGGQGTTTDGDRGR